MSDALASQDTSRFSGHCPGPLCLKCSPLILPIKLVHTAQMSWSDTFFSFFVKYLYLAFSLPPLSPKESVCISITAALGLV